MSKNKHLTIKERSIIKASLEGSASFKEIAITVPFLTCILPGTVALKTAKTIPNIIFTAPIILRNTALL